MADEPQKTFGPVVQQWLAVIRAGWDHKQRRFGRDAAEAMRFLTGPYDFFWNELAQAGAARRADDELSIVDPGMKVQCNKAAELVQLFGPSLYNRNPVRTVTPRVLPDLPLELYQMDPLGQQLIQQEMMAEQQSRLVDASRAMLVQAYLNQTPTALDLRTNARSAVVEALIAGMGVLWVEPYTSPAGGYKMVGSFQGGVDQLVIDPDATSLHTAKWVARRCVEPVWEAERRRGLPPGTLQPAASLKSTDQAAAGESLGLTDKWAAHQDGRSNDLVVYWKVWSKMGLGGRLKHVEPALRAALEAFGDYCYVEVAEGINHPINLPKQVIDDPNGLPIAQQLLQWQTPFWADCGWPFYAIGFHEVPGSPWPLNHLAPAMGELKFLNYAYSHLATKVSKSNRDFIAVLKSAGEELKAKILNGSDMTLLEINESQGKTIDQVVQFLQHPPMNGDILNVIKMIQDQFDKRTGLTELIYGQTGSQMRSGTEAQVKSDQLNIRPDDMAEQVEAAMSRGAKMEALAARWHLTPDDVRPVVGSVGARRWEQLVYTADPRSLLFDLEYRVESGSARKPNKASDLQQANAMMNNLFAPYQQYAAATGDTGPVNALIELWAKANDVRDPQKFFIKALPPAQPAGPPPEGAAA